MSETTTAIPEREKLNKKAITADQQVDRAVPCAMLNNSPKAHHPLVTI
jgi:hypothetical protein